MQTILMPGEKPRKYPAEVGRRIEQLERDIKLAEGRLSLDQLNRNPQIRGSGNPNLKLDEPCRRMLERDVAKSRQELVRLKDRRFRPLVSFSLKLFD